MKRINVFELHSEVLTSLSFENAETLFVLRAEKTEDHFWDTRN